MVTRNNTTDIAKLHTAKVITKLIPAGTTFAVIAELAEPGFTGVAYICIAGNTLAIVGLAGALATVELTSVTVKLSHGEYVIRLPDYQYTIKELFAITTKGNTFASRVAGIDGGAMPLLNALSASGASVRGISGAKYYIVAVALAFVFILGMGLLAYLALK